MIKKVIQRSLNNLGYSLISNQGYWSPDYLSGFGSFATVIDVGALNGTINLYHAFPKADLLIFEPINDYNEELRKFEKGRNLIIVNKGLGSKKATLELIMDKKSPAKSSFLERTELKSSPENIVKRSVEVVTFDSWMEENGPIKGPVLMKVDTEGFELEVLKGAKSSLKEIDTLILETSLKKRFENSYHFDEIINFLANHNFSLLDILHVTRRPNKLGAVFADLVFKNINKT